MEEVSSVKMESGEETPGKFEEFQRKLGGSRFKKKDNSKTNNL